VIGWQERRRPAITGLGLAEPPAREPLFPVAPAEATARAPASPWAGRRRGRSWSSPRGGPPHGWRRGVPSPPAMIRDEAVFALVWGGVEPLGDTQS
jgi:hypothetical protein